MKINIKHPSVQSIQTWDKIPNQKIAEAPEKQQPTRWKQGVVAMAILGAAAATFLTYRVFSSIPFSSFSKVFPNNWQTDSSNLQVLGSKQEFRSLFLNASTLQDCEAIDGAINNSTGFLQDTSNFVSELAGSRSTFFKRVFTSVSTVSGALGEWIENSGFLTTTAGALDILLFTTPVFLPYLYLGADRVNNLSLLRFLGLPLGGFATMPLVGKFSQMIVRSLTGWIETSSKNNEKIALVCKSGESQAPLEWRYLTSLSGWAFIFRRLTGYEDFFTFRSLSLLREVAKSHSVHHVVASSFEEIKEALESARKRNWDLIWLMGHGNSDAMVFGDEINSQWELPLYSDLFRRVLGSNTTVILESCNVGNGLDNYAKTFSRVAPGATVYANSDYHHAIWSMSLGKDAIPKFYSPIPWIAGETTRIYQNGNLVERGEG